MTTKTLYVMCAGITACATFAGVLLQATLPETGERPLAASTAVALIDDCRVSGVIAEGDAAVYAEFEIENPGASEASIEFAYSVEFTQGMSPMARMMPVPRSVTNGQCVARVPAGSSRIERIAVQPRLRTAGLGVAKAAATNAATLELMASGPDQWTLLISRGEIGKAAGWGGVPPVAAFTTNRLDKGVLVLASSHAEKRAPLAGTL